MPPRRKPKSGAAAAAVVVAAKKADKQAAQAKAAPRRSAPKTYRVLYRIRRQYDESTEEHIVGRYVVYADAQAKVRSFLPEWYHELSDTDWQEYAETEDGDVAGGFEVHAVDPEGDDYWVYVEEDVPRPRVAPAPAPVSVAAPEPSAPRQAPERVYAVVARRGRGEKRVDGNVYSSRAAADDVPRTPGTAIAVVELKVVYG